MKSAERAVGRASRINGDQARPRAWNNVVVDRAEGARLKRRALVAEAARAFGHRGFHNVSLDEVAIALNVSKPAAALAKYTAPTSRSVIAASASALRAAASAMGLRD